MERRLDPKDSQDKLTRTKLNESNVFSTNVPERSTSSATVHDLPPELLMEIFSCFSVRELCRTISPVCQTWYLISKHPSLWKYLSFQGQSVTTERLNLLLSHATQLQSIQLVNRVDATAILQQVALCNQNLQILVVNRCTGSLQDARIQEQVLLKLLKNCSKLIEITIKRTQFYREECLEKIDIGLPHLKRITFHYADHLGIRAFNTVAGGCKHLKEVCLLSREKDTEDDDIIELCSQLRNSLKIMKIMLWNLNYNTMKSIAQCTSLHTLHISDAYSLSDEGILLLTTLHNLYSLEVFYAPHVSSRGWEELFINSNWNSLRKLNLKYLDNIDDNVLEKISETCRYLQNISLEYCVCFREEGLSKIIKGCNQLKFLGINFTNVKALCFQLIPIFLPNLRYIVYKFLKKHVLSGILFQEDKRILQELHKKLPHLEISTSVSF